MGNAEYIVTVKDPETGELHSVYFAAPSQYRAKVNAKRHCDRYGLEFVSVKLNTDQ